MVVGGGGGGGGTNTSTSGTGGTTGFSVTADKSSIALTYDEGSVNGASDTVTVTANGSYSGTIYIGAVVSGSGISSSIPFSFISDTQARFNVSALTGMPAGTYNGTILLYACSDLNCNNPIGGTPLKVSYTLVVSVPFKVLPSPLVLSANSGVGASANLTVTPLPGVTGFTASVASGADWLSLGAVTATTQAVSAKPWRSGTYVGSLLITSGGKSRTVPVQYTVQAVTGEHDLQVSPASLTFASTEGSSATMQPLAISLPTWIGTGDVTTSVAYGTGASGWLTVTRTASGANVVASAAALTQGSYTATITFTPPAPGTAVSVPVAFTVGAGLVQPAAVNVKVGGTTTSTNLSGSIAITANGAVSIGWTASAADSWLKLDTTSGTTGTSVSTLSYHVNVSDVLAWSNLTSYSTVVTITPTQTALSPVKFTVTFTKALPEIYFLGPYTVVSGKASTIHVRGAGFDSVSDMVGSLQTSGLALDSITRVNDSQFQITVTPTSSGSYALSLPNSLGATNSATLKVVDPQTYATAVLAVPGQGRSIDYDAVRRTAYVVNTGTEAIDAIHFDGSTWKLSAASFSGVQAGAMSPDGASFLAYNSASELRLLNADTLANDFSLTYSGLQTGGLALAASTNDGRTWLGTAGDLVYFDHRSRSIKLRATQALSTNFQGPWMHTSRDGERMLITQAPINYGPPMLYMDATDELLHANTAGLGYIMFFTISDDGSRAMFEEQSVRDANFGLIGNLTLPSTQYSTMAGVLAPDGKRAYVLTYNEASLNGTDTVMPRVYVFDTSSAAGLYTNLPILGYIDLPAYPGCHNVNTYTCNFKVAAAISPDGNALFFQGDENFIVVPTNTLSGTVSVSGLSTRVGDMGGKVPVRIWNRAMGAGLAR